MTAKTQYDIEPEVRAKAIELTADFMDGNRVLAAALVDRLVSAGILWSRAAYMRKYRAKKGEE